MNMNEPCTTFNKASMLQPVGGLLSNALVLSTPFSCHPTVHPASALPNRLPFIQQQQQQLRQQQLFRKHLPIKPNGKQRLKRFQRVFPVNLVKRKDDSKSDKLKKDQQTVSSSTKRKVIASKVYFLEYYVNLFNYLREREARRLALNQTLQSKQASRAEKEKAMTLFHQQESTLLRRKRERMNVSKFHLLSQVGQGGYGKVFLARMKESGEVCALKIMNKSLLKKMNELQHILTERDILTTSTSPWLVRLFYAFQDEKEIYLAMEFVPGGDLRTLLNNSGILKEDHARFYIAEMFLAMNALHELGYIHRDLKPENFLIDATGHIKLTDFGLSKGSLSDQRMQMLRNKFELAKSHKVTTFQPGQEKRDSFNNFKQEDLTWAFSLVGSPDYMAPEILSQNGYDYSVDYWSLGCILFEFLSGYPPFTGQNMDEVWANVYNWKKILQRPVYESPDEEFNLTDDAWDIISKLVNETHRRMKSPMSFQQHPFFGPDFLWEKMRSQKPPFVPELQSDLDISYFDEFSKEELEELQYQSTLPDEDKQPDEVMLHRNDFIGFTFKKKDWLQWENELAHFHKKLTYNR